MHNPTFKSLEEIFSIRRETSITPAAASAETPRETLVALVEEAKTVLEKLEKALNSVISSEAPQSGAQSRNLIRSLDSPLGLARDDKSMCAYNDIIDGVFDGKQMVADDGALYPVPENYASKSKLVEGDLLQRAAMPDGRAYFKQVSRVARATINARLERIDTESGIAAGSNGKTYNLLHSPLRFFRVTPGDTITLEVPLDGGSWAAVVGKTETCYTESRYARLVPHV